MEFLAVALLVALVKKVVDFFRYVRAGDMNGVATQLLVWVVGVLLVLGLTQTDLVENLPVDLNDLNIWLQGVVGLLVGSVASVLHDSINAVDDSGEAQAPPLVPDGGEEVVVVLD